MVTDDLKTEIAGLVSVLTGTPKPPCATPDADRLRHLVRVLRMVHHYGDRLPDIESHAVAYALTKVEDI